MTEDQVISENGPERIVLNDCPDRPLVVYATPVIMVGGGDVDLGQLKPFAEKFPLIAVDSGTVTLDEMSLKPELLIGDFDSVQLSDTSSDHNEIIRQIKITDQYSTDFQKALTVVDAPKIYGFGFLGKRMDHALATLHAIAEHHQKDIVLVDSNDIAVMVVGRFNATLPQGIRLSIWSMLPQRFTASKGLIWPLDGLDIGVGKTLGTSNQVIRVDEKGADIGVMIVAEGAYPFLVMVAPEGLPAFMD